MSKTSKLYDQIKGHLDTFEAEHAKNMAGNKAAGSRARKAIGEVKNLSLIIVKHRLLESNSSIIKNPAFLRGFFLENN